MRILVSCANGSGTSLMMMRSVEKAMKELGVPITKIHHCAISEGKSSASQYDVVFTPVNFLQMFQQAEKRGVTNCRYYRSWHYFVFTRRPKSNSLFKTHVS